MEKLFVAEMRPVVGLINPIENPSCGVQSQNQQIYKYLNRKGKTGAEDTQSSWKILCALCVKHLRFSEVKESMVGMSRTKPSLFHLR
jgi:hypothetical protein